MKYHIFGKDGARHLAADLGIPFLGELPLVQSIRESGDVGYPAAMQENTAVSNAFVDITRNVVSETVKRNDALPPTQAVKITTMAGCAAVNKK
jgi:ATP-binding protein involved in chromosome partitioning